MDGWKDNPEKSSTTKAGEHILSGFPMSTIFSFKDLEKSVMYTDVKITWKRFVNP